MAKLSAISTHTDAKPLSAPAGDKPTTGSVLLASLPPVTNRQLLRWMFGFLRPVKFYVCIAVCYVALGVAAEVLSARLTAKAVDQISETQRASDGGRGFWAWMGAGDPSAGHLSHIRELLGQWTFASREARAEDKYEKLRDDLPLNWPLPRRMGIARNPDLPDLLIMLLVLMLGLAIVRYMREVNNNKLSMDMVYGLREAVYDKLQRVGFAFHDALSTGQLINRALSDLQNVRVFIQSSVMIILEIIFVVAGYMLMLLSRSPWVAILALIPLPIWTLYILYFSRKAQRVQKAVMEAADANVSIITENIAGVHVVKAFASQKQEIGKYDENCQRFFNRIMTRVRVFANFQPVIRAIATAAYLTLFLAAGILVIKRQLSAGDIVMMGWAMNAILSRLEQVSTINDQYQSAIVSGRRLYEVLAIPPAIREAPDALPMADGPGSIRFEQVTFGYDPARPVLKDVSFHVPGGKVVAVVGPTGSGKSTLVQLLARFYDPQKGRITVDGVDIRNVTLDSLRTQIAFVFQETYLFSETVEANVAYGRPHIKGGEVEAASRLAQAHEFVAELSKGYGTILGERGSSLSGGQKQRLAIARAILSNPRVLVLDDATAAIDPETEDLIRRGMRHVMSNRTTFLIAHRISTVKQADLVVVLEDGQVAQMGTHDELMQQDGHYRTIAEVQLYGGDLETEEKPSHMDRVRDPRQVSAAAAAARGKDAAEESSEAAV